MSADADEKAATSLLSKFLFPPKRWYDRVAKLSGGERRRLQMLRVLALQPNFLLLDEPTNDLDLDTIGVLEDFLVSDNVSGDRFCDGFPRWLAPLTDRLTECILHQVNEYLGVLLIVSHDRFFLDKTVNHLFVLPGDGVGEVLGCYGSLSACASDGHG